MTRSLLPCALLATAILLGPGCPAGPGSRHAGPGAPHAVSRDPARGRPSAPVGPKSALFAAGLRSLSRRPAPDFEGCVAAFRRLLASKPRHLAALVNLAYCHLHLGQLAPARRAYTRAIAMRPGLGHALFGLVDVLSRAGKDEEALKLLQAHLATHPRDLIALGLAASAHLALGHRKKALSMVQRALAVDRRDATAHVVFGRMYLARGDPRTAMMIFGRGLRLRPRSAALFFARGKALMASGQMGKAVMDFERAARLDPRHVASRLNLGKVYVQNLDYKGGLGHFDAVLRIWPRNRPALLGRARALFGLRKWKASLAGYQRVLKLLGDDPAALFQVAKIYQDHLDKPQKALYYYRKFVRASKGLSKKDPVFATIRMLQATARPGRPSPPPRGAAPRGPGGSKP